MCDVIYCVMSSESCLLPSTCSTPTTFRCPSSSLFSSFTHSKLSFIQGPPQSPSSPSVSTATSSSSGPAVFGRQWWQLHSCSSCSSSSCTFSSGAEWRWGLSDIGGANSRRNPSEKGGAEAQGSCQSWGTGNPAEADPTGGPTQTRKTTSYHWVKPSSFHVSSNHVTMLDHFLLDLKQNHVIKPLLFAIEDDLKRRPQRKNTVIFSNCTLSAANRIRGIC